MSVCECGHSEVDHRSNGACLAVVTVIGGREICPCNDFTPLVSREQEA